MVLPDSEWLTDRNPKCLLRCSRPFTPSDRGFSAFCYVFNPHRAPFSCLSRVHKDPTGTNILHLLISSFISNWTLSPLIPRTSCEVSHLLLHSVIACPLQSFSNSPLVQSCAGLAWSCLHSDVNSAFFWGEPRPVHQVLRWSLMTLFPILTE